MPAEAQKGNVGGIYYIDDLIKRPFELVDGCVVVPEGPGFGIDVDEEKIENTVTPPCSNRIAGGKYLSFRICVILSRAI